MAKKLIGVDLGGTTIKFAILTENGEIQQKWSLRTNILDDGSHIVPDIINSINHHLDLYKMSQDQFIGIGMGTPGTIDREKGTVIGAYNLNWKTTQNVKEDIEQGTGMQFALSPCPGTPGDNLLILPCAVFLQSGIAMPFVLYSDCCRKRYNIS